MDGLLNFKSCYSVMFYILFLISLSSCKVVDTWKRARVYVVQLLKAGDKYLVNNYIAVSIFFQLLLKLMNVFLSFFMNIHS